ncbi:hypothetical protein BSLA_02r2748 [Burkholderia stabilis]|nr:hypothetical protein BSLA_02r2748 [Burkholderia stabilis]
MGGGLGVGGGLHGERAGQGGKCGILAEGPAGTAAARRNGGDSTGRGNGDGSVRGRPCAWRPSVSGFAAMRLRLSSSSR